jgi:hypothetical protein
MIDETIDIFERALAHLRAWIFNCDYAIKNESEFCCHFFHHLFVACELSRRSTGCVRTEIKFLRFDGLRTRIEASIDFGISVSPMDCESFDLLVEAKAWIRPRHLGFIAPNSSTSKRRQCISDAQRLRALCMSGKTRLCALLIYEQGSTHLRRRVPEELEKAGILCKPVWLDIARPSMGRRKEHIGILWLSGNRSISEPADLRPESPVQ